MGELVLQCSRRRHAELIQSSSVCANPRVLKCKPQPPGACHLQNSHPLSSTVMSDIAPKRPPDEDEHPWLYLKEMLYFLGMKDSSYRMKCLLCLPKVQEILAFKNSPSNLKKHIERRHVHHFKKYGELTANTLKRKHAPKTPSTIK
ncbi:hypothetical protein J4Q44_G00125880 [Coregonus suidteri]|uniref:BED-type domain-containing protein n=1 Tax=Coregonus suidteri TaxID=861788 RepID=A0AAN8LRA4_9TELE